ncbi:winged helix DNA-binding protein [Sphingomonas psychrotolerans]|uniref:Winged helix DNA-binding protein n=1 Tax=Sphingomonas psychrotolerans TaxID=1327635 RepID=A0ABU3N687_9SPHN|nr:winged helix DNA-binding protein [Sphingomonas psychrotolerans]MDT8759001.1 winged helix DNA-binding protein [Sphingomonas psychrotolerans]
MAGLTVFHNDPDEGYAGAAPLALVIADNAGAAVEARHALELAGCRARSLVSFAEVSTDLSNYDGLDLILIETESAPEALLDLVLARADTMARERSLGIVATVLPEQIDVAAAQLLGPHCQILCNPTRPERIAAIAGARWHARGVMDDVNRETESARLRRLSEEVARIAETLARLTRSEEAEPRAGVRDRGSGYRGPDAGPPVEIAAGEIRAVIRARRMRAQFFADELFADPAWDMLLDLFAAQLERRQVSVSSLCIAAAVPPTTALRWIGTLHEAGLFERQADPSDRRRAYIGLSAKGFDGMRSYASAVKRAGLHLV